MSWSETKKINSDMSTPINTLIKTSNGSISTNIGTSSDAANISGKTLFSLLKYIANIFSTTWTSARASKIDTIQSSNIIANGSVIKSIQKGTKAAGNSYAVSISKINPAKSIVLLNGTSATSQSINTTGSGGNSYAYGHSYATYLSSLTETSLTFGHSGSGSTISWQIIEFY